MLEDCGISLPLGCMPVVLFLLVLQHPDSGNGNSNNKTFSFYVVVFDEHFGAFASYSIYAFRLPPEIAAIRRGFPPATEMQDLYRVEQNYWS